MSNISDLVAAFKTEFSGEVAFHESAPSVYTAPSIVVWPDNPFLEPREGASPIVRENWRVLVVASVKDRQKGLEKMRELSLRVRKVANANGAVWLGAQGPAPISTEPGQNSQMVAVNNQIHFRYDANQITS